MTRLSSPAAAIPASRPIGASERAQRAAAVTAVLACASADYAAAHARGDKPAAAAAGRRRRAARARLVRVVGREEARRLERALDLDRGRLLTAIGTAAPSTRPHAERALATAASFARDFDVTAVASLAGLARSVRWAALADAALDALLALDIATAATADLLRLADRAGAHARAELAAVLADDDEREPALRGPDPGVLAELTARNARLDQAARNGATS